MNVPPMEQPATQLDPLHTSPAPHAVPLTRLVHAVALAAGWQLWQGLAGFGAADAYTVPPMEQPATQLAPLHTPFVPQAVPLASFVHPVVLAAGWQDWHALAGFAAPTP
jgi:hypothetical protein